MWLLSTQQVLGYGQRFGGRNEIEKLKIYFSNKTHRFEKELFDKLLSAVLLMAIHYNSYLKALI